MELGPVSKVTKRLCLFRTDRNIAKSDKIYLLAPSRFGNIIPEEFPIITIKIKSSSLAFRTYCTGDVNLAQEHDNLGFYGKKCKKGN